MRRPPTHRPASAPAPPPPPALSSFRPTVPMVRGPDGRLQRASTSAEHIGPRMNDANHPTTSSSGKGGAGEFVRVGAVIHYGGGSTRMMRFRWPVAISEGQAIAEVLKTLSDKEHTEIAGVVFSQVSDRACRIAWLDEPPLGHYYFNQELYGENGSHRHANLQNINLDYSPDIPGIVYQGDIAGYTQQAEGRGVGGGGGFVDPRQFQQQYPPQQQQYLMHQQQQQWNGGRDSMQRPPAPVYNPDEFAAPPPQYRY